MMLGNSSNSSVISSPLRRATPSWATTLDFESTFDQAKSQALDAIRHWHPQRQFQNLDLSNVAACVAIKNHHRVVVHENPAHQRFFVHNLNHNPPSKSTDTQSHYREFKHTQNTDELIAEGIRSLDCEHDGKDASGQVYRFRTYKCLLDELRDPNYFIFSMSRPIACLGKAEVDRDKSLTKLLEIFQSLDTTDQITCRMDAKGETTKDIAVAVGLSPRAIEIRRKKMFELFGIDRSMELIRITIRLEEHGLLPS